MKTEYRIGDSVYSIEGRNIVKRTVTDIVVNCENDTHKILIELLSNREYIYNHKVECVTIKNVEPFDIKMTANLCYLESISFNTLEEAKESLRTTTKICNASIVTVKDLLEFPFYNVLKGVELTIYKEKCKELLDIDID